ncbi:MAG: substrate-binding domain-containing protein [Chloroflexota bacterium]
MNRSSLAFSVVLVAVVSLVSCQQTETVPEATSEPLSLHLGYVESAEEIINITKRSFALDNNNVTFELVDGVETALVDKLAQDQIDFMLVTAYADIDQQNWTSVIAHDSIAIVVNPENTVTGLTTEQVRALFSGQTLNWSRLGYRDSSIEIVTREGESSILRSFQDIIMGERHMTLTAVVMPDSLAVQEYVAARPAAVGFINASSVTPRVKIVALDGLMPFDGEKRNPLYPASYPLLIVSKVEPSGEHRQFPAWLLSREGQSLISRRYRVAK